MPQRRIKIPSAIVFTDPNTDRPIVGDNGVLSFERFIKLLFANPMWNESWKHGMAQRSIMRALREALAMSDVEQSFLVAEEDHRMLADAAKNPKIVTFVVVDTTTNTLAQSVVAGIGFSSAIAYQWLPMQLAIIEAEVV